MASFDTIVAHVVSAGELSGVAAPGSGVELCRDRSDIARRLHSTYLTGLMFASLSKAAPPSVCWNPSRVGLSVAGQLQPGSGHGSAPIGRTPNVR